jgi:hypothetical protein
MDDRSDPSERHCDSDVYDGRCVARVSKMLILTSERKGDSTVHDNGQAGAGLEANLPYRLSLRSRILRPRFKEIHLDERDRGFRRKNTL